MPLLSYRILIHFVLTMLVPSVYYTQENGAQGASQIDKTLESEDIEFGITVINHGAQFFGSNPFGWMIEMAEAIRDRAGEARILQYNKVTGNFDELPDSDEGGETILICDWVSESDNLAQGFSEAAADALFSALLYGEQTNQFVLENIHFIGHSRGCSVNSETVERLLRIGVEVEQVTNLDAHDWGAFTLANDYDVNPDTLVIAEPSSRSPNRGIVAWQGIWWSDSYWQTEGLAGRSVYGTFSLQLDDIGHSAVHDWYLGTIDNTSGDNAWYGGSYPERNETGYNFSRIGGLDRPAEWGEREKLIFEFENDAIVNGDFERGPSYNFDQYPGWSEHGGGGGAIVENGLLVLDTDNSSREHNRFYVPHNAQKLSFFLKVTEAETGTPPDADKLTVSIKTIASGNYDLLVEEYTISEVEKNVEVDISNYKSTVATLLFELNDGGMTGINSDLQIDDLSISIDKRIKLDITVFLEGAYQNYALYNQLNEIPLDQPYDFSPWNYNGNESVSEIPPDVVDWILIELRDKNYMGNILGQRAAFLLSTGKVADIDGSNPVSFSLPEDEYYIGVQHRNHLAVMSAEPLLITIPKRN